eukprot:TRINITY_DN23155_c0_g1_i1.p1 TRINITY_DN23155_c0_g1~~TRINITY_DN23155_c0_g1_i1.p1  ORF type:complete len:180 (-),score=39.55 TRINITY_DN23155_c0_g1_i1:48-587(-)
MCIRDRALRVRVENRVPLLQEGDKKPRSGEFTQCENDFVADLRRAMGDIDHMLRFKTEEESPENSMAWSLRGRIRFLLGYDEYEKDFQTAIKFAPKSFATRAMNYLCVTETIGSPQARKNPNVRERAILRAQVLVEELGKRNNLTSDQESCLEDWKSDLQDYVAYHEQLLVEEAKCTIM